MLGKQHPRRKQPRSSARDRDVRRAGQVMGVQTDSRVVWRGNWVWTDAKYYKVESLKG